MTARSGESVTSYVRIVLKHTFAAVWMDTSWSKTTSAKLMCQVRCRRCTSQFSFKGCAKFFSESKSRCRCILKWQMQMSLLHFSWTSAAYFYQWWRFDDGRCSRALWKNTGAVPGKRKCCGGCVPLQKRHYLLEWHIHRKSWSTTHETFHIFWSHPTCSFYKKKKLLLCLF